MMMLDNAYKVFVTWEGERCPTCNRDLPRIDSDGLEEEAWQDDELEAVFCTPCQLRWRSQFEKLEEAMEELPPHDFVREVIRALIRRGGVLTVTQSEHLARVLGTLDASDYEATPVWKQRRDAFIAIQPRPIRCELCLRSTKHPQVHHRTYERKTAELDSDLAVLCDDCHHLIHKPHERRAADLFYELLRDFEEKSVLKRIYALLPRQGWLTPAAEMSVAVAST